MSEDPAKSPAAGSPEIPEGLPATIRYAETDPGVRLLTIDRPERMNAIGPDEADGLTRALTAFRDDDSANALVITGSGPDAFCAGADLHAVAAMLSPGSDTEPLFSPADGSPPASPAEGNIGPTRWTDVHKPIIAAVNGAAYAGGLEWACLAHIRVADQHASFGVTCRRWNVGLGDGGTQRLPRLIGMSRALDLIITGRVIGAPEAERIGLVSEVTPSGTCLERALALAREISALPQPALRTDLEAAVRGFGTPLDEGLAIEAGCFDRLLGDPELLRGATRFVDRDHPDLQPGSEPLHPPTRAYAFAARAHRDQSDPYTGRPFINHPVKVAYTVAELSAGGNPRAEAAAFMHDVIEKAGVGEEEVEAAFGREFVDLVLILGQDPSIADRAARRADHRARVAAADSDARLVYAADRLDGIDRMIERLEQGDAPDGPDPDERLNLWREDIESVGTEGLPAGLVSRIADRLAHLERLLAAGS